MPNTANINTPSATAKPTVSIVLPTYNRERFLSRAFESIRSQSFADWELIIIDDGSTDQTRGRVEDLSTSCPQSVTYEYQENSGPALARNRGVRLARGDYIAFFDSDDYWLPHHLFRCVDALNRHDCVDWVYGACRVIDDANQQVTTPTTFRVSGRPRSFFSLNTFYSGNLRIIDDPRATEMMIENGLHCGPQCSVIRRRVFDNMQFPPFRIGEDQLFVIMALKAGCKFAYYDDIHVEYHVHADNSSQVAPQLSVADRLIRAFELVDAYEKCRSQLGLSHRESRALNCRLSGEYFWNIGYVLLWQNGRRAEALEMYWRGIKLWPWNLSYWKTYLLAHLKTLLLADRGRPT